MEAELTAQTGLERAEIRKWSLLAEALQNAAERAGLVKPEFLSSDPAE